MYIREEIIIISKTVPGRRDIIELMRRQIGDTNKGLIEVAIKAVDRELSYVIA